MIDVVWYNEHGCELSREKCDSIEEARTYVGKLASDTTLEPGDSIKLEEVV